MFKLQRLEITGFKSFADYTEIIFTGKGITAVVGPNGCGKSNVSDAISWVLGEQRIKSLRGEEMKDVIFQGTNERKPSGMSEVVLHLVRDEMSFISDETELEDIDAKLGEIDRNAVNANMVKAERLKVPNKAEDLLAKNVRNKKEIENEPVQAAQAGSTRTINKKVKAKRRWSPRSFALDFAPGEAVTITRRLYLSGESEYLLNNKNCRLRDIQDLFAGTGLSGSHYAIIEQGRIEQILSSKPINRRNLVEEAAGISKFRKRQRAAEARLEAARNNLGRISDIVSEIEKQTRILRSQANKTKRYKILREDLRRLLKQTYAAEGKDLYSNLDDLREKLGLAKKAEQDILARVSEREKASLNATQDARKAEEDLADVRTKHSESTLKRDRVEREYKYQKKQVEELVSRSSLLEVEIEVNDRRLVSLAGEIACIEKEEAEEREVAEKEKAIMLQAEAKYCVKLGELKEIESRLEREREEHLLQTAAVERLAEIERQFENNLEKLTERKKGLRRERERAKNMYFSRKHELENLENGIAEERKSLKKLIAEKQILVEAASETRRKLERSKKKLKEIRETYLRQKHRLETLRELEEKRAIYTPRVQKLFAEQENIGVNFIGTLADELRVDAKAEKAIENLFGDYLQTVLVRSENDAKKTLNYLNKNNLGRISVLVDDSGQNENPALLNGDLISGFLGVSRNLLKVLANIFPREMSAKVVEKLDLVDTNSNEIFVTLDGNLIIGGKLYIGGKANHNAKNSSLLGFKRELRELAKDFEVTSKGTKKASKITAETQSMLVEEEDKLLDLQDFITKRERELLSKEIQVKALNQETARAERHKNVVAEEISQIETEIKQIRKRLEESGKTAKMAEKTRILSAKKIEEISSKLMRARRLVEDENTVLSGKRTRAEVATERKRSTQHTLIRLRKEREDLSSRHERQRRENEENEKRIDEIKLLNDKLESKIASFENEIKKEEIELNKSVRHLKETRRDADAISAALAELNKESTAAMGTRAELEVKKTEIATRIKNLNERCLQELNLRLIELVEETERPKDFDLEKSIDEVAKLRQRLDNFGAINMLALEELSEVEERLEFLSSQRQDIIDSIASAEETLLEIKKSSRRKFRDAFEAINKNFTDFFRELFGGGKGKMTLLEADDILESGIEIAAQPPGKRLQNMLLLSGGEKAMTAIALVLAIFKYRPSPFCLLDEVDAPLDDTNVVRFVEKITAMSEKTQFIIITHNKRTMEAAKALYGVTMQEAGVSKMVSARFE